jgi:hypothetical protein
MEENNEWKNNEDLDEFKELMHETLFNTYNAFSTATECIQFIDNSAKNIFLIESYLETKDIPEEIPKDLIKQFNLCLYFVARDIIDELDTIINEIQSVTEDSQGLTDV